MDKKIEELEKAEKELTILINTNKKAWVKIYIMIEQIETKELWKAIGNSFSGWLKNYAKKTGTNESMLWHRRQAGKFYSAYEARAKEQTRKTQKLSETPSGNLGKRYMGTMCCKSHKSRYKRNERRDTRRTRCHHPLCLQSCRRSRF